MSGRTSILVIALACAAGAQVRVPSDNVHIVLPEAGLLRAPQGVFFPKADLGNDQRAVYPVNVLVDFDPAGGGAIGMRAVFDKSVSIEEVTRSVQDRYSQWRLDGVRVNRLWRVVPESFAISVDTNQDGYVEVSYLPFVGDRPCEAQSAP